MKRIKTKKNFPGLHFNSTKDRRAYFALCKVEVKGASPFTQCPEAAGPAAHAGGWWGRAGGHPLTWGLGVSVGPCASHT